MSGRGANEGGDSSQRPGLSGANVPSDEGLEAALVPVEGDQGLPPVLLGHATPEVQSAVSGFYSSVEAMFEAWLARRNSPNTRRAYRRDVMDFVEFLELDWPAESWKLLQATVPAVQAWRDYMNDERDLAPNTLNRRISSVSGFYRFMREAAAESRLPITVPNPAHSQFISREAQEPVTPTEALSATRVRQLLSLPEGDSPIACRDRAILKFVTVA